MGRKWTEEQKEALRELWREKRKRQPTPLAPAPPASCVSVGCSVKVSMDDLTTLNPAQMEAFMGGLASVVAETTKAPR